MSAPSNKGLNLCYTLHMQCVRLDIESIELSESYYLYNIFGSFLRCLANPMISTLKMYQLMIHWYLKFKFKEFINLREGIVCFNSLTHPTISMVIIDHTTLPLWIATHDAHTAHASDLELLQCAFEHWFHEGHHHPWLLFIKADTNSH